MTRSGLVLAAMLALATSVLAQSRGTSLEPYRRLAHAPEGAHLLALARSAMEGAGRPDAEPPASTPAPDAAPGIGRLPWPGVPLPVYVSLVRGRETRACVGVGASSRGTLGETVQAVALEALSADRRRPPVLREELDGLRVVITITDEGEPVADPMVVNPAREGLLIRSPRGSVAFLPGEARTVRWALSQARRLGVLNADRADASFRRLEVVSLAEPARRLQDPAAEREE